MTDLDAMAREVAWGQLFPFSQTITGKNAEAELGNWTRAIAAALLAARNEALEEAAKVVDEKCESTLATQYKDPDASGLGFKLAVNQQTRLAAVLLPGIAARIRDLKEGGNAAICTRLADAPVKLDLEGGYGWPFSG
jgi:hypothetical protein